MLSFSPTDTRYIKKLFDVQGGKPKKTMGQNFLICPEVVEATLTAAEMGPRVVTELGAGLGALTQAFAHNAFQVRAIEKDDFLARVLQKEFGNMEIIEIIHEDMRRVDWVHSQPYQIVGNVPYNLSGFIIRHIIEAASEQAILLLQQEVADRIMSNPPQMNLQSLAVQLWGKAHVLLQVPATCFWPQPTIASTLVLLERQDPFPFREELMKLAKIGFQEKRKQLFGTLHRNTSLSEEQLKQAFQSAHVASSARPQEVSSGQWKILYQELS